MENSPATPPVVTNPEPINPNPAPHTLIILLVVLVLSLLGSTSYLAFQNYQLKKIIGSPSTSPFPTSSPITDSMSDWKIYTNAALSVAYPNNWGWKLTVYDQDDIGFVNHKEGEIEPRNELRIAIYENPRRLPLYDFIMQGKMGENYGETYWKTTPVKLVLKEAENHPEYRSYEPNGWPSANGEIVRLLENKERSKIAKINVEPEDSTVTNLFYQILSTFRFLK